MLLHGLDHGSPDTWDRLAQFLRSFSDRVGVRPDALVVVSGHHEGEIVEVSTAETPPLLFDYYGFPPHTYELTYPAPGSPGLGRRIGELLADQAMGATIAAYAFGRFGSDPRDDQR